MRRQRRGCAGVGLRDGVQLPCLRHRCQDESPKDKTDTLSGYRPVTSRNRQTKNVQGEAYPRPYVQNYCAGESPAPLVIVQEPDGIVERRVLDIARHKHPVPGDYYQAGGAGGNGILVLDDIPHYAINRPRPPG